jgi:threonine dehydrogenase-like Zn-dependent dehydrogenase
MPKELICPEPNRVAWRAYEDRPLNPGEVRVRAQFGAEKHGTMAAFFKGYANERGRLDPKLNLFLPGEMAWRYPIPLGNMIVGPVVEAAPDLTTPRVGDRVACFSSFKPTTVARAEGCWVLDAGVPWESAVCLDPATFALGAIRDGNVRLGDVVVVFGLGAIGLVTVRLARAAGATVYAVDPVAERREQATKIGATGTFAGGRGEDVALELRRRTNNRGADVAIEFSGAMPALQAAIRTAAFGGTVVCGAFPAPYPAGLDLGAEAHHNRPNLVFSRACSDPNRDHPRWNERRLMESAWSMIAHGTLDGRGIVGPVVPFESLLDEYPRIAAAPGASIKLGVRFE